MHGLVARFDLQDASSAEAFDDLVARTLPLITGQEPGTLQYAVHAVEGEPLARVFYELYADADAFAAHEAAAHTAAMLEAFGPLLAAPPRVEHFASATGKNLPS